MTIKPLSGKPESDPEFVAPIVLDLGKTRKKHIKALKNGEGKLVADVQEMLDQVRASLGDRAQGVQLVPVVVVYKRKPKRRKVGLFGF